jgi:SAM-dependent methyltransferase
MPSQARLRVADVGSGPGGPARALFPEGWLIAFDLNPQPLSAYVGTDGRVVADAAHMPCQVESLDVVCAFDILEHVDDDLLALQEWRRILVPGGWLILSVPAYQALWSQHDIANAHRRRYRAEHLRSLLRSGGFTPVRITYFNTLLLPGVALVRWAERVRGDLDGNVRIEQAELDLQKRLPKWMERCCEEMLSLEARWIRRRALPAGVSIGAIARAVRPTDP